MVLEKQMCLKLFILNIYFSYNLQKLYAKNEQKPTKKLSFMIKTLYVYIYVPNSWADGQTIP